ncbi:hypothetical protein [Flectobacillus roseus]|uniref:hypothetical protein n=1 Tax=Flectobacillus roseus TaxID=502259 RepID=UPI0024B708A2|nr:hypothetical protein [Flectobacillus roseus]MDI9872377.1 hypothetical protein [Flectobacillus roseus]
MKIGRTLFWFEDGDESLSTIGHNFYGLSILLNRLLNEKYDGKSIQFINIYFRTEKTYELHPNSPKEKHYYYGGGGGHLKYNGIFDRVEFIKLNWKEMNMLIWEKSCTYLSQSAKLMKNQKLLEAVEYAYKKGLEIDLNPNYKHLTSTFNISDKQYVASLCFNFKKADMFSNITVECDNEVIFEKEIHQSKNALLYFLEVYKSITFDGTSIVVKMPRDVDYLPVKIPVSEFLKNP